MKKIELMTGAQATAELNCGYDTLRRLWERGEIQRMSTSIAKSGPGRKGYKYTTESVRGYIQKQLNYYNPKTK